jgi:hypothetical protein
VAKCSLFPRSRAPGIHYCGPHLVGKSGDPNLAIRDSRVLATFPLVKRETRIAVCQTQLLAHLSEGPYGLVGEWRT